MSRRCGLLRYMQCVCVCVNKFNSQFKNQIHLVNRKKISDSLQFVYKVSNLYTVGSFRRCFHRFALFLWLRFVASEVYTVVYSWYAHCMYGTCVLLPFWIAISWCVYSEFSLNRHHCGSWCILVVVIIIIIVISCARVPNSLRLLILHTQTPQTKRKSIIGIAN